MEPKETLRQRWPGRGRTEETGAMKKSDDAPAVMTVEHLNMYYGSFMALKDVSMVIRKNRITALIGPSGCGKSTFIRSLNRMHEIVPGARVEGRVTLDGEDIYAPEVDPVRVRRRVGMVFQKPNPFPTMSIYDNVIAGLKLGRKRKKSELDEIVERTLRQAALWDEVKNKLSESGTSLSGGQQQRLCIARTLALEPEVILMDEPASALDPVSTQKIEDAMLELKEQYTVVIVTHNMQQAARVSDYTGFFFIEDMGQPGQLWEFGETEKIFSNPDRKETEDYVTGRFG
ncbi:Phosphate transport system permease protein 1 [Rubrobacter xylanophilus DSM 9941]|uniref:Phosphate import ATP-binding protein PstB n=2 Tax=Rubrobacter xylanophilus TaxID=49319 RepID=PSTB_RUBXD|nr:RecName: Full=Phosphate import ATP-binding protein PstB; AltName: Full=ABC phosphate transporter; AltName: Full=Phosphate-transporting ATPase [Rubrobacter xylanophilus DSM 9941]ABG03789.1 Phosphate transport system permease protein 1 [Rubrobacter xylanophilus DSM 9941]